MKRLESLDALRGFDMFFIMGGAGLIVSIANCFPESTFWHTIATQMNHVEWKGLRHHDTIFPLFLFIAGISFPFSLERQRSAGKSTREIYAKILRRGITLVLLGMIYNNLLTLNFNEVRFCSVLGRIGVAWMFAAMIYTITKKHTLQCGITAGILVTYWLIMALIPAPDYPDADIFSKEGSIACYIDRIILGASHMYKPIYEPEGLLSNIPAIATALIGMMSGAWIKEKQRMSGTKKALVLVAAGIVLALIGWAWSHVFPINKALWSSSFVCAVAGYSLIMLALFYYIIDVRGWRKWAHAFVVIGMNSITIYMAQRFIAFGTTSHRLLDGLASILPEQAGAIVYHTGYILICWLFLYFLYKKKVFLRI